MGDFPLAEDPNRLARLHELKHEALNRRAALLAEVGPDGKSPLVSIRVVIQDGGPRTHSSSEGTTTWDEPNRLYLATFMRLDRSLSEEVCVEEEDAIRWAFALGWGEELG
jgi:hypothetical protein